MESIRLREDVARRFLLGIQGLWPGRRWTGRNGAAAAIRALGRLQLDPVSLVARSHDLVLASRVTGYHPDHLNEIVYGERLFFEYGGHLDVYPSGEYPYWDLHKTRRRNDPRVRMFLAEHADLVKEVRALVRDRGPLAAADIPHDTWVTSGRARTIGGLALYNLWLVGELMTHHREGFERHYDLAERVAPPVGKALSEAAVRDHAAVEVLRRSGLSSLREWSGGVGYMLFANMPRKNAAAWMSDLVARGLAVPVRIEGHKAERFVHAEHVPILELLAKGHVPRAWESHVGTEAEVTFLSPLDNLVAARERVLDLFGFELIWEIYKPAEKRRYGAYTMPILYQDRLVGRMDPKMDRGAGVLHIRGLWIEEEGLSHDPAFKKAFRNGLDRFARFHEARETVRPSGMSGLDW